MKCEYKWNKYGLWIGLPCFITGLIVFPLSTITVFGAMWWPFIDIEAARLSIFAGAGCLLFGFMILSVSVERCEGDE